MQIKTNIFTIKKKKTVQCRTFDCKIILNIMILVRKIGYLYIIGLNKHTILYPNFKTHK